MATRKRARMAILPTTSPSVVTLGLDMQCFGILTNALRFSLASRTAYTPKERKIAEKMLDALKGWAGVPE